MLDPAHCQSLVNLLNDRPGALRGNIRLSPLSLTAFGASVDGVGFTYSQSTPAGGNQPRLCVFSNATLYSFPVATPLTYPPTFGAPYIQSVALTPGKRVRMAGFGSEAVIVYQGGNGFVNLRITATGAVVQCGVSTPLKMITSVAQAPTGGTSNKSGLVQYVQTCVDELGRESSPSPPLLVWYGPGSVPSGVTVDINAGSTQDVLLKATGFVFDGIQSSKTNFYATVAGGSVFYLIGSTTTSGGSLEDNFADNIVAAGNVGPNFGENNLSLPANLVAAHNGRIFMDVVGQPGVLQVSNQGSMTQFCPSPLNPTDGLSMKVISDQNNPITGLISFMSFLMIFLRRGLWVLEGQTFQDFDVRMIHDRGCIAPDSLVRADNHLIWLADDGIYVAQYFWRFELQKFSKPIEADLQAFAATPSGRAQMEAAVGWFVDNCYHLAIGNTIFRYDFDTQGWTKLQLGGSVGCAAVVQQSAVPGLAVVGRSDVAQVDWVDELTPNQSVTGMVYRTRLLSPDPAEPFSHTQQARTLRKRIRRVRVIGEGTITSGTLTLNMDGRSESYSYAAPPPAEAARGVIWYQEFTPAMAGINADVQLSLNGTGVVIRNLEADYCPIG